MSTYTAYFRLSTRIIIAICLFLAGLAFGQYSDTFLPGAPKSYRDATDLTEGYQYIDPLLFCSDHEMTGQTAAFSQRMQNELTKLVNDSKNSGHVANASVLYRDLRNGPRVSVNGDMDSFPASLLKIPLALSIYRRAESDSSFLQKKVLMNISDQNSGEYYLAPWSAEAGKEYTIEELLDLSLIHSDNNATDLLIPQLTDEELRKSYEDLGIEVPVDNPGTYSMNVGVYASFFRILYNASYLSRDSSEKFLSDLSKSSFTQGIVAGLPDGVKVSHKFGEFTSDDAHKQLHDCGIVYKPGQPYILCVMTQGNDFENLAATIATISKKVWNLNQ